MDLRAAVYPQAPPSDQSAGAGARLLDSRPFSVRVSTASGSLTLPDAFDADAFGTGLAHAILPSVGGAPAGLSVDVTLAVTAVGPTNPWGITHIDLTASVTAPTVLMFLPSGDVKATEELLKLGVVAVDAVTVGTCNQACCRGGVEPSRPFTDRYAFTRSSHDLRPKRDTVSGICRGLWQAIHGSRGVRGGWRSRCKLGGAQLHRQWHADCQPPRKLDPRDA